MHILLIPSWYSHLRSVGAGSFFRDQAQALAAAGHKVGMVYPKVWGVRDYRAGPLPDMNVIRNEDEGRVRLYRLDTLHRLPRVPFRDAAAFTRAGQKLFDAYVAAEGQPDILHAHATLNGGVLAASLKKRSGVPFVLTEHSTDFAQGKHRWWQKSLISRVLSAADVRISVSPELRDLLVRQYGRRAEPVSVIPNILTPAFEKEAPAERSPGAKPVFLCVARISAEKNQDGLIRAFAEAFPPQDDAVSAHELHFIGSGDGQALISLANTLGIGDRVKILGVLPPDEVRRRMAEAFAVVLASFVETFGVVVIEALSQGTPVIATVSGGPEGILTPESGILVPVRDHAALVAGLSDMLARGRDFDRKQLRRNCLETYGEKAVVGQLEGIYGRVLGQDGGKRT
ncbi:MAG: glycosyltransferase [Rhodospirillales bacterium]